MNRLVLSAALALTGCEQFLEGVAAVPGGAAPKPPTARLSGLALTESPQMGQLAAFFCNEYAGDSIAGATACRLGFGAAPARVDLRFGFETVFELGNPNAFSVPLVEMLLALDVFEGDEAAELGTVCVSFCNPEAEDCTQHDPAGGCRAADKSVRDIEDFVPTVEDLVRIATNLAAGESFDDNLGFRFIPAHESRACRPAGEACSPGEVDGAPALCCGGACEPLEAGCTAGQDDGGRWCALCDGQIEARVRFDLGIDPMLSVLDSVVSRSASQLLQGVAPDFDVPTKAEGSLFFDVPVLGRFALGFGPLSDTWSLD